LVVRLGPLRLNGIRRGSAVVIIVGLNIRRALLGEPGREPRLLRLALFSSLIGVLRTALT
jgi:hypothetical protein